MKRVPTEERKISTTFAVSLRTLELVEKLAEKLSCSRSAIITEAVRAMWEDQQAFKDVSDLPDDVRSAIIPFTGSYEEDL